MECLPDLAALCSACAVLESDMSNAVMLWLVLHWSDASISKKEQRDNNTS